MLRERIVWITGGGSGMGRAAALLLARDGARVIISARSQAALDQVVEESAGRIAAYALDVGDAEAVAAASAAVLAKFGGVDVLVNAAGVNIANRSWPLLTPEAWQRVIQVNLNGALHCTLAVLPGMRACNAGLIINVSSWAGRHYSMMTGAAYSASKAAMAAMTMSLNLEECRHGIRACVIYPGETATPIMQARAKPPSAEELARMLQPDDVAAAIRYVAGTPGHVCVNELVITPTWNRNFLGSAAPPK